MNTVAHYQKMVIFFCLLFFAESIRSHKKAQNDFEYYKINIVDVHELDELRSQVWRSQRNIYLTGFALFVSYALNRYCA